jgi:hypothetical protein
MKKGIKTKIVIIIECVGPRCTGNPKRNSVIMSMSGIIERTRTNGMLKLTLKSLPEPLANRYEIAR